MCSCVFCYFAGMWMIADQLDLIDEVYEFGVIEVLHGNVPNDIPWNYLYIGLAVYTLLFAVVTYILFRFCERAVKEQEQLQEEASVVMSYTERMKILLSQYERNDIKDVNVKQKLQTLSRQIASLPPTVVRNANLKSEVSNIVETLQDLLSDKCSVESFSAAIDNARDSIDSVKRRSVTIK